MPIPLLSTEQVSKRFGYRTIFQQVTFDLFPEEFILLIGNNGTGKSTLFRLLCSLSHPSSGTLRFNSCPYRECLPEVRRNIGFLGHDSRLYPDLSAMENLHIFGTLYNIPELEQRINSVLDEVGLVMAKTLPVRTYSSGMTKRLMIAHMILIQPKVLLLDEPYTGLDPSSVEWFQTHLKQFRKSGGAIMLITHQLDLGLELADRVLVLHQQHLLRDIPAIGLTPETCSGWLNAP